MSGGGHDPAGLCVMLSGGGRTLANLLDRIDAGDLDARVRLVIASRPCGGVDRAAAHGIPVEVVRGVFPAAALEALCRTHGCSWVVCAGYLQLVDIPATFSGRVVNIHPALLPRHGGPGMFGDRVHEAVLASGDEESGCTVHLCDSQYDRGEIVLQKRCAVLPDDTVESLSARVFELEREAYPEALSRLLGRGGHPAGG